VKKGNKLWVNEGDKAADADKLDGVDSSGFLQTADQSVLGGVHTVRPDTNTVEVDRSFNNVTGQPVAMTGSGGAYDFDFGFPVEDKYATCTIDQNYTDTRNAVCTVQLDGNFADINVEDPDGAVAEVELWLVVFG
jgi:hypothetical protein